MLVRLRGSSVGRWNKGGDSLDRQGLVFTNPIACILNLTSLTKQMQK